MLPIHLISIDVVLTLTQGRGHKVKGQGQKMHVCKELVSTIYHESMIGFFFIDINNRLKLTYSQGHKVKKSRSNRQLCKKKKHVSTIYNEPMLG